MITANNFSNINLKFNEWYSTEVKAQLDNGDEIDDIQVGLQLTKLKPVHAGWIV